MKKAFLLVLFAVAMWPQEVSAYSSKCTHPTITAKIAEFYGQQFRRLFSADEIESLKSGASHEDAQARSINHFYDPTTGKGWSGKDWGPLAGLGLFALPSVEWVINPEAQSRSSLFDGDYSWPSAIKRSGKDGLYALAHSLHLIEDLTVPAHTRDDTHALTFRSDGLDIWPVKGDPMEIWMEEDCNSGHLFSLALPKSLPTVNPADLQTAMMVLAELTNASFFSASTIKDPRYARPIVVRESKEQREDTIYVYRYLIGVDSDGKEYYLAKKTKVSVFLLNGKETYTLDYLCVNDTWQIVRKWLFQFGPAVIDLYFHSVEAATDGGRGTDAGGVDAMIMDAGRSDVALSDAGVLDGGVKNEAGAGDNFPPDNYASDASNDVGGDPRDSGVVCQDGEQKQCGSGLGVCAQGTQICSNEKWGQCQEVKPNSELCDGLDNDCDGQTDEDFLSLGLGQLCGDGIGACRREGINICGADKMSVVCPVSAGQPIQEICGDKIDNDCDGQTDEADECPIQPPVIGAEISGIIPDVFSYTGGKFQIHVSPIDPSGQLITQNVTVENFSFSAVSAAHYTTPTQTATTGQAQADSVEIKMLSAPGKGATILMMFDSSGSMTSSDPDRKRVEAGKQFVDAIGGNDRAGVLDFGAGASGGLSASRLLQDLTSDKGKLKTAIDLVESNDMTPLYDSLMEGLGLVEKWSYSNPSILVLTDGQDTASTRYSYSDVIAKAQQLDTPLFIVPLGSGIDFSILQKMADQSGGTLGEAYSAQKLIERFKAAGVGMRLGRIIVHGSGVFSPPLTVADRYLIRGTLITSIGGAIINTPFEFSVDIGK